MAKLYEVIQTDYDETCSRGIFKDRKTAEKMKEIYKHNRMKNTNVIERKVKEEVPEVEYIYHVCMSYLKEYGYTIDKGLTYRDVIERKDDGRGKYLYEDVTAYNEDMATATVESKASFLDAARKAKKLIKDRLKLFEGKDMSQ